MEQLPEENKGRMIWNWTIDNIAEKRERSGLGYFVASPTFVSNEWKFQMQLYPAGLIEKEHMSLKFSITKKPVPTTNFRLRLFIRNEKKKEEIQSGTETNLVLSAPATVTFGYFCVFRDLSDNYLIKPDGPLQIFAEVTFEMNAAPENATGTIVRDLSQLDGFRNLFKSGHLSDFTIVSSEGKEFPTHSVILSARSEYFAALFRCEGAKEVIEKKVVFQDISAETIETILRHIYTEVSVHRALAEEELTNELVSAVDMLRIPTLIFRIGETLVTAMTVDNVIRRLVFASKLKLSEHYYALILYFNLNKTRVLKTEDYKMLCEQNKDMMLKIFEADALRHETVYVSTPFPF
ncbi:hypothetical protein B9Z55_024733 [Caenorhabditis nigoni]|nr:hypothetical protein B9Z55_024733 [Caenorhabditis nigoni]